MFKKYKIKNKFDIKKYILKSLIMSICLVSFILINKKTVTVADGKNDLVYDVEENKNVFRNYNNVAVFGDSRLSTALYSIPVYRGVTYYTFEGFNFDDMMNFLTGTFIQNPKVYESKLSSNTLLHKVNLENLTNMYNRFLLESKKYDKIIVQVGINSLQIDSSRFQGKYMQFINLLHDKCPKAKMYLVKIFGFSKNFPNYQINNSLVKKMNDSMDELCSIYDYINVIVGKLTFVNDFDTYQIKDGYSDDGIHINEDIDEYNEYVKSIFVEAKVIKE